MKPKVRLATVAPWDQGAPAIHGPNIYGASIKKPFLYAIPATGERPLEFSVAGLPDGLRVDPATGYITGAARHEGDSQVLLRAENRHGKAEKEFSIAIGGGLALTPPMGWNSWNAWRRWVDDEKMRAAAGGLVRTGLAARGYTYVNTDSCWQGARGGKHHAIQPNRKFPDMGSLAKHIHSQGLKFGIYSSPWTVPCGCPEEDAIRDWGGPGLIGCSSGDPDPIYDPCPGRDISEGRYVGMVKHEPQDVEQWVEWGVDFLKYDWRPTDPKSLARMGRELKEVERDILFSVCTNAQLSHVEDYRTWAHMWRSNPDARDDWSRVRQIAFMSDDLGAEGWRKHIGPGNWYDLDILALGPQFHTQTSSRPNKLTPDEQISHMTAWALYPSPLILSCDLEAMSNFELRLFGNEEVIAVNQDRLGKPAVPLHEGGSQSIGDSLPNSKRRIWGRPLEDGSAAVGLFNLAESPAELSLNVKDMGFSGSAIVRNLWERRDLGRIGDIFSIDVPPHGAQLVQVKP